MYEIMFLKALGLTLVLETAILALLAGKVLKWPEARPGWPKIIAAGVFASAATLPFLWFFLPFLIPTWWQTVLVGETAVIIAEALFFLFFLNLRPGQALFVSLTCNLASFLLGLVVRL